ncbi:hypothetical protein E2C01_070220 [Portunus trituberculatus]|uniref:Uncharacterized protein n=1 Tax=Portunus trituberculatus TaxID=210409 RepID=A0A5B7I0Q9_PORTR|nr:hypothetical protein [Portunus trituberculatus]
MRRKKDEEDEEDEEEKKKERRTSTTDRDGDGQWSGGKTKRPPLIGVTRASGESHQPRLVQHFFRHLLALILVHFGN